MKDKKIMVIGASARGIEALKTIAAGLESDLNAAVFVVWHLSPDVAALQAQSVSGVN